MRSVLQKYFTEDDCETTPIDVLLHDHAAGLSKLLHTYEDVFVLVAAGFSLRFYCIEIHAN